MKRYYTPLPKENAIESSSTNNNLKPIENENDKRARIAIEVSDNDIIGDPGLRKPINTYHSDIRDSLRRRYVAKGPCQPLEHTFPLTLVGEHDRKFQTHWYSTYKWLEYSVSKDAAYCLYCYLFGSGNKCGDTAFTEIGYTNWKKALGSFVTHEGGQKSAHGYATQKWLQYQNQRENVDYVLSTKCSQVEIDYRIRLTAVVGAIRHLLEEGLPFRGHDESKSSIRRGNFLGLLKYTSKLSEKVRKVLDLNAPGNNQLTSPSIQKEIIEACASETRKIILNEIGDKVFSLLVDEARDSSVKEQMAVVLRYVNNLGEVIERFIGIVHVSETTAISLKKAIDDFFAKNGLSLSKLRGQGYDGASNMRGALHGLKALILNENKHAFYVHCFAHQLQLVVVAVAGERGAVSTCFDYLPLIVNIVGASCKRKDALLKLQHEKVVKRIRNNEISTGTGKNQETNLVRPGATRWGSHYRTLVRLFDMWDSVEEVLSAIHVDGDDKNRGTAGNLLAKMVTFEFVLVCKLMMTILGITNEFSQLLQAKDQNMGNAIRMLKVVKINLQTYRHDGWEKLFKEVSDFCNAREIHVPNMEDVIQCRARRLIDKGTTTYLQYYRGQTFSKAIDDIIETLDKRFTETNSELLMCITCLDPSDAFINFDHERLLYFAELYSDDFSSFELTELDHQLRNYICDVRLNTTFSSLRDIGELAIKMVENKYHTVYRLVYRLIELALVLPVATATVERCFSAMNIIKSDLRNRMGDDFLADCLICYVEKKKFMDVEDEDILQNFHGMKSRRIYLPPIDSLGV